MRLFRLTILVCMFVPAILPAQGGDPGAFWARQMGGLQRAVTDPSINQRVYEIWIELVEDTGMMFPVWPAQQNNLGQALPNGVILLDLSVAGDDEESVTAFWLAHEYGHQVIGHPRLMITQMGQFIVALGGTRIEDDADRWAARFLNRNSYDIDPVLEFLCDMPGGGAADMHSTGPQRARNVASAFGDGTVSPCDDDNRPSFGSGDSCEFARDGECDEPGLCSRGTDSTDCRQRRQPPPQQQTLGSVCYTNVGACPMTSPYPLGGPCTCFFPLGVVPGRVGN